MAQGNNASRQSSAALAEATAVPLERLAATPIPIAGEVVHVGKLGINQLVALARTVVAAAAEMSAGQRDQLKDSVGTELSNIQSLLAMLDPKTVCQVFAVAVGRPEEWVAEHLGALEALLVIDAVLEHNDIQELQAVFSRLAGRFRGSQRT